MADVTTAPDEPRRPSNEFNQKPEQKVEPKPDIATAEELHGLYESLAKPKPSGSELTIGGTDEQVSHESVETEKMLRIKHLEGRLNAKKGNFPRR